MKVVFIQNIKGTAKIGDIKNVPDGYARNFLIPRKLAVLASENTIRWANNLKSHHDQLSLANKQNALSAKERLLDMILVFQEGVNAEGHLYGSVDREKIAHELKKQGIAIEPPSIGLDHTLKAVGEHTIELKLHPEVLASVKVKIEAK